MDTLTRRAVALALCLAPTACHRRRHAAPRAPRWYAAAVDGPSLRVEGPHLLRGALRVTNGASARGDLPATALAATARLDDGTWRFAAEDGTVYAADAFDAPLRVVTELPFRLEPVPLRDGRPLGARHSRGLLVVVDTALHAHVVAPDGATRPLPLGRVLSALGVGGGVVLAVVEPGDLLVSRDGGARFEALRAPAGVPLAAWMADGRPCVRTTAGTFEWRDGSLAPADDVPSPERWLHVPADIARRADAHVRGLPWALDLARAVRLDARRVAAVEGEHLVVRDLVTGVERERESLPGEDCALHPAHGGLRAVCRRGWARAVFARDAARPGWSVLRDEARAEPLGDVVFDDASRAWAVMAPCAQRPVVDDVRVCLVDADGVAHEHVVPGGELRAMHAGVALVTHGARELWRVDAQGARAVELSPDVDRVLDARWTGASVEVLYRDARERIHLATARGVSHAPDGAREGLFTPGGEALATSASAAVLASSRGGAFVALPSPVRGLASSVDLALDRAPRCLGDVCALGALTRAPFGAGRHVLTRSTPQPAPLPLLGERARVRCTHGAVTPAPEIDRGVAASGYAVQARLAGTTLSLTWEGELVRGASTSTVRARPDARLFWRGVPHARTPAALVELCAPSGCDHLLGRLGPAVALGLGRAQPGGVEAVLGAGGGWVVRADSLVDGVPLVTLVRVSAQGAVVGRRTLALADRSEGAHVGSWLGRDGLWIEGRDGRMRFAAADGSDANDVPEVGPFDARTPSCAEGEAGMRGEARVLQRTSQVEGPEWFVEAGEWQVEEVVALDAGRACVRAITAGEARDEAEMRAGGREEREPVRSFVLRGAGGAAMVGRAWSGRTAIALRCARQ